MPQHAGPVNPRNTIFSRIPYLTYPDPNRYSLLRFNANVAQLVEQIIRNDQVVRSIRIVGSIQFETPKTGGRCFPGSLSLTG